MILIRLLESFQSFSFPCPLSVYFTIFLIHSKKDDEKENTVYVLGFRKMRGKLSEVLNGE